jgi:uncharacterized protein YlxW (UPF0749 family)
VISRHGGTAPTGTTTRVVDASMTLINEVYRRPLDPGYAEAAARRTAGEQPRTASGRVLLVALAAVLGLGIAAATIALRQPASSAVAARDVLEKQIQERGAVADAAQQRIDQLTAEISGLQGDALGGTGSTLASQIAGDAVAAGSVGANGPGLRIVLSDAPTNDPDKQDPADRVQDVDLQVVVDGLWAAGAEAVAVNGQRLTSTTAIRSAGDAILVDLVALSSPYTVEAIGSAPHMQADLARTTAGQHLATLRTTYGIGVTMSSEKHLALPGSGQAVLHYAQPTDGQDGSPSATSTGSAPTGTETGTTRGDEPGARATENVAGSAATQGRTGT